MVVRQYHTRVVWLFWLSSTFIDIFCNDLECFRKNANPSLVVQFNFPTLSLIFLFLNKLNTFLGWHWMRTRVSLNKVYGPFFNSGMFWTKTFPTWNGAENYLFSYKLVGSYFFYYSFQTLSGERFCALTSLYPQQNMITSNTGCHPLDTHFMGDVWGILLPTAPAKCKTQCNVEHSKFQCTICETVDPMFSFI